MISSAWVLFGVKGAYHMPHQDDSNNSCFAYSGEGDNIRVYVRVRPPDKHLETDVDRTPCLEVTSGNTIVLQSKPDPKNFSFDHVADINTTQVLCIFHRTVVTFFYIVMLSKVLNQVKRLIRAGKFWLLLVNVHVSL